MKKHDKMKKLAITLLGMLIVALSFGQYQEIINGESGLSVRTKMNNMHAELYNYNLAAEYSSNGTSWHSPPKLITDKYMRFTSDQGDAWTSPGMYYFDGVNLIDSLFLNSNKISGLAPGTNPTDAVNVQQLIDSIASATGISGTDPALVHSDTVYTVATQDYVNDYIDSMGVSKNIYSIGLPYATTVQGRVAGSVIYGSGTEEWELSAGVNSIDLEITHGLGRRVANINVCTVSGTAEQLLRPFAGAYSGWQTTDENTLLINALATTPLPLKIYIIFE